MQSYFSWIPYGVYYLNPKLYTIIFLYITKVKNEHRIKFNSIKASQEKQHPRCYL